MKNTNIMFNVSVLDGETAMKSEMLRENKIKVETEC